MNLCLLLNPFSQQLLDEVREILSRIAVFQQPCRRFLRPFSNEHRRWLIVGITALARWSTSAPHWCCLLGGSYLSRCLVLYWSLERGKNTGEFARVFRHG